MDSSSIQPGTLSFLILGEIINSKNVKLSNQMTINIKFITSLDLSGSLGLDFNKLPEIQLNVKPNDITYFSSLDFSKYS